MSLGHEELYLTGDGIDHPFRARNDDFEVFEEGLVADRTVRNVDRLAVTPEGRLYRVTLTEYGERFATFPL
jgi:hypothetical protein